MSDKIVICRCEDVTLKDLRLGVEAGYDDLEGLKRYSGFGTGFCQGKQCVALVARELVRLGGRLPEGPITPRPPVHPIALGHLATLAPTLNCDSEDSEHDETPGGVHG